MSGRRRGPKDVVELMRQREGRRMEQGYSLLENDDEFPPFEEDEDLFGLSLDVIEDEDLFGLSLEVIEDADDLPPEEPEAISQ